MTGRCHKGDENGKTKYEYSTLKAVDADGHLVVGIITIEDVQWTGDIKENSGIGYDASSNRVIVGRQHKGDENGNTRYATAIIKFNGKIVSLIDGQTSAAIKESAGIWFKTDKDSVMTGRYHSGDENGQTYYSTARVLINYSSTDLAPAGTVIVPDKRNESPVLNENTSSFICPSGTVLTGRSHTGDENGDTQYEYASLKAVNSKGEVIPGVITVEDVIWDDGFRESSGMGYDAPINRVIVGRQHEGDENGTTKYATAVIKFNGHPVEIRNYTASVAHSENGGWNWFRAEKKCNNYGTASYWR